VQISTQAINICLDLLSQRIVKYRKVLISTNPAIQLSMLSV